MASRYPTSFHLDFCYNPVRLSKNGRVFYVPCGRCNGCRLQKSNSLSQRLGDDIENSKGSIFFTLTYDNYYVPKLFSRLEGDMIHWYTWKNNIRYNGKRDVVRENLDFYSKYRLFAPLHNYSDNSCVGYLCKKDIQLYLKLLRKSIYDNFNIPSGAFRYYVIGEYGPGKIEHKGKFRPHYHGIILPCNKEVADFLLDSALYENWKMCDKNRFTEYTKYCDSGTRSYVTEYVTSTTYLPRLLTESKEIRPFNLCSRQNGALGTLSFDKEEVSQSIERGIDEYIKRVPRIERNYIFLYPSYLTSSLFPKCARFSLLSFDGLLRVYSHLFNVREVGVDVSRIFDGLCDFSLQDYQASKACLKVCDMNGWTPYHYVEVLDEFYYRKAQRALKYQYEFQQNNINNPLLCIAWYYNYKDFLSDDYGSSEFPLSSVRRIDSISWFLSSFGFDKSRFDIGWIKDSFDKSVYESEVDTIISLSDKSKKVNAKVGLSPD